MTTDIRAILAALVQELDETRRTVCVDGDASYQHGVFQRIRTGSIGAG